MIGPVSRIKSVSFWAENSDVRSFCMYSLHLLMAFNGDNNANSGNAVSKLSRVGGEGLRPIHMCALV